MLDYYLPESELDAKRFLGICKTREIPKWQEQYQNLKHTPLWENGLWRNKMEINTMQDFLPHASVNLLDNLIQFHINPQAAAHHFLTVRHKFFSTRSNLWSESPLARKYNTFDNTHTQFYAILAEKNHHPEIARAEYSHLKRNAGFISKKFAGWKDLKNQIEHGYQATKTKLLGILLETQFNPENALQQFTKLKETACYHKNHDLWQLGTNPSRQADFFDLTKYFTATQLLAVLCELQFSKPAARKKFLRLKNSWFFDHEKNLWNHEIAYTLVNEPRSNTPLIIDRSIETETQLLGILCEILLEEKSVMEKPVPLPLLPKWLTEMIKN